eukprot:723406-Prymnesium_polylepis.1
MGRQPSRAAASTSRVHCECIASALRVHTAGHKLGHPAGGAAARRPRRGGRGGGVLCGAVGGRPRRGAPLQLVVEGARRVVAVGRGAPIIRRAVQVEVALVALALEIVDHGAKVIGGARVHRRVQVRDPIHPAEVHVRVELDARRVVVRRIGYVERRDEASQQAVLLLPAASSIRARQSSMVQRRHFSARVFECLSLPTAAVPQC